MVTITDAIKTVREIFGVFYNTSELGKRGDYLRMDFDEVEKNHDFETLSLISHDINELFPESRITDGIREMVGLRIKIIAKKVSIYAGFSTAIKDNQIIWSFQSIELKDIVWEVLKTHKDLEQFHSFLKRSKIRIEDSVIRPNDFHVPDKLREMQSLVLQGPEPSVIIPLCSNLEGVRYERSKRILILFMKSGMAEIHTTINEDSYQAFLEGRISFPRGTKNRGIATTLDSFITQNVD